MIVLKKNYFFIIKSIKDIDLRKIKKRFKFIIIYRNSEKKEKYRDLLRFRNKCKSKSIAFFVANDTCLAVRLKSDGIYISANNKEFKSLFFKKKNFKIIGSAHNIKEIKNKIKQGCEEIFLSRLFKVNYKPTMSFLGINKFNFNLINIYKFLVPLGGINFLNLNKLKNIHSKSLAIMSEVKKKPAIIRRLF